MSPWKQEATLGLAALVCRLLAAAADPRLGGGNLLRFVPEMYLEATLDMVRGWREGGMICHSDLVMRECVLEATRVAIAVVVKLFGAQQLLSLLAAAVYATCVPVLKMHAVHRAEPCIDEASGLMERGVDVCLAFLTDHLAEVRCACFARFASPCHAPAASWLKGHLSRGFCCGIRWATW